jgi:hypothetical protein
LLAIVFSVQFGLSYACEVENPIQISVSTKAENAESGVPDHVDMRRVDALLDWIEENTQYEVSQTREDPPEVSFCKMGDQIDYEGSLIIADKGINAAYDSQSRRIHIVGPWDQNNIRDQSILLHELIHDVQLFNRDWYCLQEPEWETYKLQDKWLQEQGMESGFDWLYIYFLSRCPRDHHP